MDATQPAGAAEPDANRRRVVGGLRGLLERAAGRLRLFDTERRQAAETARELADLRARQELLVQLGRVQRAITRREPLQQILDTITAAAQALLGEEVVGLRMVDPDDPQMLLLVSSIGLRDEVAKRLWRVPVGEAGATGQALARDELVVMEPYVSSPHHITELADEERIQAAMAFPVHDAGTPVGGLVVASYRPERVYTDSEREVLRAFAEHVSLAVTEARTQETMYQAFHDSLTGLASRKLLLDRLGHGLACAAREGTRLAVLFVDLDRFKLVNDSLGHAAGDALLVEVAERISGCLRTTDTAARLGGDEFAVVLHGLSRDEQAVGIAAQIIEALRAPFVIDGQEAFVNASIGIAFNTDDGRDAEMLLRDADLAMYQVKKNGKGRYEIFEPALRAVVLRSMELEAELRRAVDRGEFVLRYQPIVALSDQRVTGVEALVRWQHPERGLIPPLDFIPLAEETGLILPIDRWVLHEACRQASRWNTRRRAGQPLTISVNLSARQFAHADLPEVVAGALASTGLAPARLVLEITESLLLRDTAATMSRLAQLSALGVRLAMDDFGTGYSSLAYLRRFPVDILKIDKSFVDEIATGPDASAVARAIVHLGQVLRLTTVAEGIEAADQLGELVASGCELGQGYYFAKPLESGEIEDLLTAA